MAAIESTGTKVFTFAPSAEASRGVLRSDAGFANAETVEALLQNPKLQAQVRGQVIWIDEAGLLSVRTLARVADLAEKENCRIILSGDTAQHRAVERGDALRLLEKHANLQAAELKEIWRQKADAHKAVVADLRAGDLENAFKRLDKLGMLREMDADKRHEALATDYVAAVKEGKSALGHFADARGRRAGDAGNSGETESRQEARAQMNANSFNSKICNGRKRNAPMPGIIRPGRSSSFIKTSPASGAVNGSR